MVWKGIKNIFGGREDRDPKTNKPAQSQDQANSSPELKWIKPEDNPWGVPVLDIRPFTLGMVSASKNPQCAENAISFARDDGTTFIGKEPPIDRTVKASLRFPIDRVLAEGVLFIPRTMEHQWAIFYHRGQIIFVRSWLRQVHALALVEQHSDHMVITEIRGGFLPEDEGPAFTIRVLDYILRSHALDTMYPAPFPARFQHDTSDAALWCFLQFGNRALLATHHEFDRQEPTKPLRSHSLLHLATARGDVSAIEAALANGIPVDLLAADGLAPLHWALARKEPSIMKLLLERGSPVDVRSDEGATPLMNVVQSKSFDLFSFLLDNGADVNARDNRGFTALHRAAEMGQVEMVRELLNRRAKANPEADGHTPRSLAEAHGHAEIVALLNTGS